MTETEALREAVAEAYAVPLQDIEAGLHSSGEAYVLITKHARGYVHCIEVSCTIADRPRPNS